MSLTKKRVLLFLFLMVVFTGLLQVSGLLLFNTHANYVYDKYCAEKGGVCLEGRIEVGSYCVANNSYGNIQSSGCFPSSEYSCCVPLGLNDDHPVISDRGCKNIGGECQKTNSVGGCTLSSGGQGCYMFGGCRTEGQDFSKNDLYLCCADAKKEGWCIEGVAYELWGDVYLNGNCPFSRPSIGESRLWCSQGVETPPSHNQVYTNDSTKEAVDIILTTGGKPGTEYFIAPADGFITKAQAYFENSKIKLGPRYQRCGCYIIFETKDATYEIRHCFLFGGVSKDFDSDGNLPAGHPGILVKKGEVIAKIALESDHRVTDIIPGSDSCNTYPHFHIKVTGPAVDRCVDCFLVDKLECNLYNDGNPNTVGARPPLKKGECGRCYRQNGLGLPECFKKNDFGAECDDGCERCNIDPEQYCCDKDLVRCEETGKMICKCPHPDPAIPRGFKDLF